MGIDERVGCLPEVETALGEPLRILAWRVVDDYGHDTFEVDQVADAASLAATAAVTTAANGCPARLLFRTRQGWFEATGRPACIECEGTGRTAQGWTEEGEFPAAEHGPCATCRARVPA